MFSTPFAHNFHAGTVVPSQGSISLNSEVRDILIQGTLAYMVGLFTTVTDANGTYTRNRAACLDLSSSLWTAWNPNFNNTCHTIIEDVGTGYGFITGSYTTVGGNSRVYFSRVSLSTGTYDSGFNAGVTSNSQTIISALIASGSLYAFGQQEVTSGSTRDNITKHNQTTGALDTAFNIAELTLTDAMYRGLYFGGVLYGCGSGTSFGGTTRNKAANFNLTTGAVGSWDPNFSPVGSSTSVRRLATDGTSIYAVGSFDHVNSTVARAKAAKLDTSGTADSSWNPGPDGTLCNGLVISSSASSAWIGGDFSNIGGLARKLLAKVDLSTGAADSAFTLGATVSGSGYQAYVTVEYGDFILVGGSFATTSPVRTNFCMANKITGALS